MTTSICLLDREERKYENVVSLETSLPCNLNPVAEEFKNIE